MENLLQYSDKIGIGGIFILLLVREISSSWQLYAKKKNGKWVDLERVAVQIDKLYTWHGAGNEAGVNALTIANGTREMLQRQTEILGKLAEAHSDQKIILELNGETLQRIENELRRKAS